MFGVRYRAGRLARANGTIGDLEAADFRCVLVKPTSSYLQENPATMSAFTLLEEITASSGKVIANKTLTEDVSLDTIYLTADDPEWTGLTPAEIISGMVIYFHVTNFGLSIPMYGLPLQLHKTIPVSGEYTWVWNEKGILEL